MSHPAEGLDEIVHQRTRLGILAVLVEAGRAQFGFLKETLGLSDGNLSRHLTILEEAGYVAIEKGYEGKRPRTWVTVTKKGRGAFASEIAALKDLVHRFDASPAAKPTAGGSPAKLVVRAERARSMIDSSTPPVS